MDVCVCSFGTSLSWTMCNLFFAMCRQAQFKRIYCVEEGRHLLDGMVKWWEGDPNVSVQYLWNEGVP